MIEVRGAEQLADLSRRLKTAGDKDLQRELSKGIAAAMQPLRRDLPRSAQRLPRRGGLAKQVAGSRLRIVRRNTGRAVGLRLTATNPDNIRRIDKGEVRHKTYGHLPWQTQRVTPGWFTDPAEAAAPAARREVEAAMTEVVRKIEGRP